MLNINISTPVSVMDELKDRYKDLRLSFDFTQAGLARRSGVSLGSIKRFERSGQISFESLLKLSLTLECLDDFAHIANPKKDTIHSIDQLLEKKDTSKKRGNIA